MKLLIGFVCVGVITTAAMAADKPLAWPRFRGPNGSGIADDQKPPVEFGPDKNVKWKAPAPSGLSSPIIARDKLVITAFDDGKLYTIAYNRVNGKEAWRAEAPVKQMEPFHKTEGSPAASTPATDGQRIVSYFGSCGLFCYDLSGKQLWKFEMPTAATGGDFGSGVSPIIAEGTVVLVRDERKESKILALDAGTGSRKWEQARLPATSYCTPVVCSTPSGKQIVTAGHARMIGYDLKTGAEKWSFNGMPAGCIPSPVVADETLFFAGGGGGADDKDFQMVKDGGIVTAYDAKTGEQAYQERVAAAGQYYASPVAADGHIYFTSLQDGTITVLKAGSDKPEVVATNPKLGERTAATPAIADDTLFVRTDKHLYAFAEKK